MKKNVKKWSVGDIQSFTFVVTQNCNLACKYCYELGKNNSSKMSKEIAFRAADFLIDQCSELSSVIIDFIGGEPLLEVELMDEICDYIKFRLYEENHHWFGNYEITMTTNGTLYDKENVQRFIKKNQNMLTIGISLDGTKEKHDAQRIKLDGTGSYDDVVKNVPLWLEQFPEGGTKLTFASDDLKYLKESIIHVRDLGIKYLIANVVNEDVWKDGDDLLLEQQLKDLADYMIDHNLEADCAGGFFNEMSGRPFSADRLKLNWCNCGENNLAVDNRGFLYSCIRFLPFTLAGKPDRNIGNIFDGIDRNRLRAFECLNFETQCSETCLKCPVAEGCQWCVGNNYGMSVNNTIFERTEAICKMHKATCRASDYYFGRLRNEKGYVRRVNNIDRKRYLYILTEKNAVQFCTETIKFNDNKNIKISLANLKNSLEYARNEFLTPIIVFGENDISNEMKKELDSFEWKAIKPATFKAGMQATDIVVITPEDVENNNIPNVNCVVLKMKVKDINKLSFLVQTLLQTLWKVNLVVDGWEEDKDYLLYREQLKKINAILLEFYKKRIWKQMDVITDTLFLKEKNNCNAGVSSFAYAPDGQLYPCPNFYYDKENGIIPECLPETTYLDISKASGCKICDVYHCKRCIYDNYKKTNEYPVPSKENCELRHIERSISKELQKRLSDEGLNTPFQRHILKKINYEEPLDLIINEKLEKYECK